jgi:hypothetical protein
MASLSINNDEIYERLAMQMGFSRDTDDWAGNPTILSDANRIIRAGRRKFFSAHDWSFLEVRHDITIVAPASTGTVTVVSGAVTLAGGTFATTVANQLFYVGGSLYRIDTRDSGTQVTLKDLTVNADAGSEYKVYTIRYDLPTNFSAIVGPVTLENTEVAAELQELPVLPEHQVRGFLSNKNPYSARPKAFCVYHTLAEETGIATHFLELYPLPDEGYLATMRVRVLPGDSLAEAGDVFGAEYAELMMEAILAACEQIYNDSPGLHTELFQRMLPDFVRKDKVAQGVRRLKPRSQGRGNIRNYELIVAPIDVDSGSF